MNFRLSKRKGWVGGQNAQNANATKTHKTQTQPKRKRTKRKRKRPFTHFIHFTQVKGPKVPKSLPKGFVWLFPRKTLGHPSPLQAFAFFFLRTWERAWKPLETRGLAA